MAILPFRGMSRGKQYVTPFEVLLWPKLATFPSQRPHLNGSCHLCIQTELKILPRGHPVELVHRSVILFCALPLDENASRLLQTLECLKIRGDHADDILFLLKEVLEKLYPHSTELERIQALIPDDTYPGYLGQGRKTSSTLLSRLTEVLELAETMKTALIKTMQGRLGLLRPGQQLADPGPRVLPFPPRRHHRRARPELELMPLLPQPEKDSNSPQPSLEGFGEDEADRKSTSRAKPSKRKRKMVASVEADAAESRITNRPKVNEDASEVAAVQGEAES